MTSPAFSATRESEVESLLAGQLAAADRALGDAYPILRHRLGGGGDALLNDRIVAHVRALLEDLAGQLPLGEDEDTSARADKLTADPALVRHVHALALEAELAERLGERMGLDPVVSPLLQALAADSEPGKDLLAEQARFLQGQRRGELALAELPGDLQEALAGIAGSAPDRLDLLERVVGDLDLSVALDVIHAGVAVFATALARAVGITRETVLIAMSQAQAPRLAVALRAAGLGPGAVGSQLFAFDPDARAPDDFDALSPERAAVLLAGAR